MKRVTIPAEQEFDEGKKGPWLKLTWDEAYALVAAHDAGDIGIPRVVEDLRAQLAAQRNEDNYRRRLGE